MREVVAMRPATGQARFLVTVRKEPCGACRRGVRTISVWSTLRQHAEEVAWCEHCFNATCRRVQLRAEEQQRFTALRSGVAAPPPGSCWNAVRPALEDLERRGLL